MAANSPNYQSGPGWVDLYSLPAYSSLANQRVTVQCVTRGSIKLFAGGPSQPADSNQGFTLSPTGASWSGTTDHLWLSGTGAVAVGTED